VKNSLLPISNFFKNCCDSKIISYFKRCLKGSEKFDNDGYAEKVGWVDADDGQLAMDRNGNDIDSRRLDFLEKFSGVKWDQAREVSAL